MAERLYHIDCVHNTRKTITRMTGYPMPHAQCMTMLGKITSYPWRSMVLTEVSPLPLAS